jgi:haloalkane dehalogenase
MDTMIMIGQDLGEAWRWFRDLVAARPDFPVGRMVRMGCHRRPTRELVEAYDAPFPNAEYKAGVQAFPRLVPLTADHSTAIAGSETLDALRNDDDRPALLLWGQFDSIFPREQFAAPLHSAFPHANEPLVVKGSGHFLFEDEGRQIGSLIARWLGDQPRV